MLDLREKIKQNTNKINCFVDPHQPEFINTMSRTMDAYNTKISTFGGKNKKNSDVDNFIAEKGLFIRTSNLYEEKDPLKIV